MEEYSATHTETVEELLDWPAKRVEAFYLAYQKRTLVEQLTKRKEAMVNALFSNSNYDGSENSSKRDQYIQGLEDNLQEAIGQLYSPYKQLTEQEKTDKLKENPFFAAVDKGLAKQGVPSIEEFKD